MADTLCRRADLTSLPVLLCLMSRADKGVDD